MVKQFTTKESVVGLLNSVVDSSDIGNLLTKVAEDLKLERLDEAKTKLDVLGHLYGSMSGCAFFRSTASSYHHYLGLKQWYEQLRSDAPPRQLVLAF